MFRLNINVNDRKLCRYVKLPFFMSGTNVRSADDFLNMKLAQSGDVTKKQHNFLRSRICRRNVHVNLAIYCLAFIVGRISQNLVFKAVQTSI